MAVFTAMIMILIVLPLAFFFVLTAGEVGRVNRQQHHRRATQARPDRPTPPPLDAAEQELRLRYARGEIDREEFLQRKIDLER
ncbi:SHOCT domain-containing protein [Nocardiopsis sp. MG754419]|uniref:SHOCT domain-containing protein n=1 Tax=Nocardiopsis sp. MG754419 TaxID=2259865 RepID=UPI001BA89160|nr:SHOCT domain-containing protein [Nocardiopsis sp. MG754419]MBR8744208.1 SHOCT domain-containing protein [Nocardiopsis sp. MG754419]